MAWAFTITTNYPHLRKNEADFKAGVFMWLMNNKNINIQNLDYTIEQAPTMGLHMHGTHPTRWKSTKGDKYFTYWQPLTCRNTWTAYMLKDVQNNSFSKLDYQILIDE